jgi:hypothetical protein
MEKTTDEKDETAGCSRHGFSGQNAMLPAHGFSASA